MLMGKVCACVFRINCTLSYLPSVRMFEGVKQLVLSICQFVSLSVQLKNFKFEYRQV